MVTGKCQCGAIRYEAEGEAEHCAICHCADCRASSGAPMMVWAMFPQDRVQVHGAPMRYQSSENVVREFCGTCGTGLFYTNAAVFPGMVDIQAATFDDPDTLPPQAHIQVAEAPAWAATAHELPKFDRYPGP